MRIALFHNFYRQRGGEDAVFEAERDLLRDHGHQVAAYTDHNARAETIHPLRLAAEAIWSASTARRCRTFLQEARPQVAHFHNTFALISPAAYHICRNESIPVVQTLHNYRQLCPAGTFYRDTGLCFECRGGLAVWPSVRHKCFHGSRLESAVVAAKVAVHRWLGTWDRQIDVYIALSENSRRIFVESGFPASKIVVKPHFLYPTPEVGDGSGGYALFAGRLAPGKGLETLLAAWRRMRPKRLLRIAGDGPSRERLQREYGAGGTIEWLGALAPESVLKHMQEAAFLVFPSENYETFGRVVIEALATGTPVVSSDLRGNARLVANGQTGLYFRTGDSEDLAARMDSLFADPALLRRMRGEARHEFETHYTAAQNYRSLMRIYGLAIRCANHREAYADNLPSPLPLHP